MANEIECSHETPAKTAYRGYDTAQTRDHEEMTSIPCIAKKYEILECLGRGSQGEVYRGKRLGDGSEVAIKVMHIKSVKNWKMYELFDREAKVLLTIHVDGVAKFYEAIEDLNGPDPVSVIVQQYIDGHALSEFIKAHHRFLLSDIADILIQLTTILESLHALNPPVIHRDIKPSNIMLQDTAHGYRVWLIDFGAVANPVIKDGGSTLAGTYGYMAPEQLMGQPKPASDLYSMAVMAFYLLTGVAPESLEIADFRLLIDPHLQNLPFSVTLLLRQMLEPHIDQRLTDTKTIRRALELIKKSDFKSLDALVHHDKAEKIVTWTPMKSYKQPGCIEQWDALSDVVPRKIPREAMNNIENRLKNIYALTDMEQFSVFKRAKCYYSYRKSQILTFSITAVILLFPVCFFIRPYFYIDSDLVACVYTLLFIAFIILPLIGTVKDGNPNTSSCKSSNSLLRLILSYGRKTFATVKSIEFEFAVDRPSSEYCPLWKVTYTFNPVDDSSDDDLVRYFYTRRRPDDLKPGDLIPCLYIITCTVMDGEYVYSIPWPILEQDDVYLSGDFLKARKYEHLFVASDIKVG